MKTEFDLGFIECCDTKVSFLYARIEDAIMELQDAKVSKADVIKNLRRGLKASDDNKEDWYVIDRSISNDMYPNK